MANEIVPLEMLELLQGFRDPAREMGRGMIKIYGAAPKMARK